MVDESRLRVIFTADDFGLSTEVNHAVIRAHQLGTLSCASLMVGEPGWEEAVELAKANPSLGVGLHLTLSNGHSVLSHLELPDLVNEKNEFRFGAVTAGFRYFFNKHLHTQLRKEIEAQFARFKATGLKMDHVNGHLNMHLHPRVLPIVIKVLSDSQPVAVRLPRESLVMNLGIARGQWMYRLMHGVIFYFLSQWSGKRLIAHGIPFADQVYGLLQTGRMSQEYVNKVLSGLSHGMNEFYFHPGSNARELEALLSSEISAGIKKVGAQLVRYQDLPSVPSRRRR